MNVGINGLVFNETVVLGRWRNETHTQKIDLSTNESNDKVNCPPKRNSKADVWSIDLAIHQSEFLNGNQFTSATQFAETNFRPYVKTTHI